MMLLALLMAAHFLATLPSFICLIAIRTASSAPSYSMTMSWCGLAATTPVSRPTLA